MNWALMATVVLTLSGSVAVSLERVVYAKADEDSVSVTQVLGSDGGTISIDFGGALRQVVIPAGALLRTVPVMVTVNATPDTDYPDNAELRRTYPPELLKYISPKLTVELPLEALDWQSDNVLKELLYLAPGFDEGAFGSDLLVRAEIRTELATGENSLDFKAYGLDEFVTVRAAKLQLDYRNGVPDNLNLSVQIVDETALYKGTSSTSSVINEAALKTSVMPVDTSSTSVNIEGFRSAATASSVSELYLDPMTLFEFTTEKSAQNWYAVDDVVMGGVSRSKLDVEGGTARFSGRLSLEKGVGFASVRYGKTVFNLGEFAGLELRVRGDDKAYQFRLHTDAPRVAYMQPPPRA